MQVVHTTNTLVVCASIDDFKALAEEEKLYAGQLLMLILETPLKLVGD